KCRFRLAEIIFVQVAIEKPMLTFEFLFQCEQMLLRFWGGWIQIPHHNELQCRSVQVLSVTGIGIHFPYWVITAFDVLFGTLTNAESLFCNIRHAILLGNFQSCSCARPLKEIGITVSVFEISKLPDSGIFLINCIRNFVENKCRPFLGRGEILMPKSVIRK